MNLPSVWITGPTRSGKTQRLTQWFATWVDRLNPATTSVGILVLAATGDNRLSLVDRFTATTAGKYPFRSTTPLGFFEDEVMLFWALLIQELDLKAQFPLRLAPETELELATQLWQPELDPLIAQNALLAPRLVRRLLDLLQLAALAGLPVDQVPTILADGLSGSHELLLTPNQVGEMLQRWQTWCLERGFVTYGIIAQLYGQILLPNSAYQTHLHQRYQILLADDVDEYPAIARTLFETMLNHGATAAFTYNPDGAVRLGLGADPAYMMGLAAYCQVERLDSLPEPSLASVGETVVQLVTSPILMGTLPDSFHAIRATTRIQLLQQTVETITTAIQAGAVAPGDVAIIAPGLDAIARYSLVESFARAGIRVEPLNDQRPLSSAPLIRALLTLLTLIYPGLGRLVDRDAIAEMLVVLSQNRSIQETQTSSTSPPASLIDPIRAGLLADYCFVPHPDQPHLLPAKTFPRWDRLGYQTATAYDQLLDWITTQQAQLNQRLIPNVVALLDRAIQHFLMGGGTLPFDQLSALRQLMETAQHYWEVSRRVPQAERYESPSYLIVSRFIQLLRSGAVTANPYPVQPIGAASNAITLATVFQYRSSRRSHRWHCWLDAGSSRWLAGVDALFGAPLFLHEWSGRPWTAADTIASNERRLRRILLDLLGRVEERVYLCHSDLATSGQEQLGGLLSLVDATSPQI